MCESYTSSCIALILQWETDLISSFRSLLAQASQHFPILSFPNCSHFCQECVCDPRYPVRGDHGHLFPPFGHEQKFCYPDCVWQTFYDPLLQEIQHRRWQKKAENGTLMTVLRCPISGSSWCESENSLYHLRQFQLGFLILTCRDMAHWETIKWVYAREWFALVPFFKKGYSRLRKQIYWLTKEKLDQEESCRSDCSCLCERL